MAHNFLTDVTVEGVLVSLAGHTHTLDELNNVYAPAPQDGYVLKWIEANNRWEAAVDAGGGGGVTAHSQLTGLDSDDHPQYLTEARGDSRYAPVVHNHDDLYSPLNHLHDDVYAPLNHTHDYSGLYAPLVHDHNGVYSLIDHNHDLLYEPLGHVHADEYADILHTHDLDDLGDVHAPTPDNGDVLVWVDANLRWEAQASPSGVTDHGALDGLADDDHTQYYNQTRGDARYSQLGHTHDDRYYTETELQTAGSSAVHWENITNRPASGHLFFHEDASDLAGHDKLRQAPAGGTEEVDAVTLTAASGHVTISQYITEETGGMGIGRTPAGVWNFSLYAGVSALTGGDSFLHIHAYRRTQAGVETELFSAFKQITTTSVTLHELDVAQPEHTFAATDRLVIRLHAQTDRVASTTVTFVHEGVERDSHFYFPIVGGSFGDMRREIYDTDLDGVVDAAESVPWAGVTGAPATFPPSAHTHALDDLSDVYAPAPGDGHVLKWVQANNRWESAAGGTGGVTDHGALTGLEDDDHEQYFNEARGDARYALANHNHNINALEGTNIAAIGEEGEFIGWSDVYGAWVDMTPDHGALAGLGDDDHILYLPTDGTRGMSENLPIAGLKYVTSTGETGVFGYAGGAQATAVILGGGMGKLQANNVDVAYWTSSGFHAEAGLYAFSLTSGGGIELAVSGTPLLAFDNSGTVDAAADWNFAANVDIAGDLTVTGVLAMQGDLSLPRGATTDGLTRTLSLGGARSTATGDFAVMDFNNYDGTDYTGARISAYNEGSASGGSLRFYTADAGALGLRVAIDRFGNSRFYGQVLITPASNASAFINVADTDFGAGSHGPWINIGRNTNATQPAAGWIRFYTRSGTTRSLWFDASGNLRFGDVVPTNANDAAGSLVAVQGAMTGLQQITMSGNALQLNAALNGEHVYMSYYPNGSGQARRAYTGFPSNGSQTFTIGNEYAGGQTDIIVNALVGLSVLSTGETRLPVGLVINEVVNTPANPTASNQAKIYVRNDRLCIAYLDGAQIRYRYMALTGTGATWTHTTTPP